MNEPMTLTQIQKRGNTLKLQILTGRTNACHQEHYIFLATQRNSYEKLKGMFGKTVELAEVGGIVSAIRLPEATRWVKI